MKFSNINKWIGRFCAVAAILVAVGVFTISNTFGVLSGKSVARKWDVYFTEPFIEGESGRVIISNDRIDMGIALKESGDTYSFETSINNGGQFDAKLDLFEVTNLEKIKFGTSTTTGKTYYLSDYVKFDVYYEEDNLLNGIRSGAPMKRGDRLVSGSNNKVRVTATYISYDNLTDDQIRVLKDNATKENGYLVINANISISAVYQEA